MLSNLYNAPVLWSAGALFHSTSNTVNNVNVYSRIPILGGNMYKQILESESVKV